MDFFASQDLARALMRRLIFLYVLSLLGVVISLNVVAVVIYGVSGNAGAAVDRSGRSGGSVDWMPPPPTLASTRPPRSRCSRSSALATMFKQLQLGGNGAKVAELLGGREITATPTDPDERKLVNVVDEMSLASGVPKPRLFVMDDEDGIDAFAAERAPTPP